MNGYVLCLCLLLLTCAACKQDAAKVDGAEPVVPGAVAGGTPVPTEAEIAEFLPHYSDAPGSQTLFEVEFGTAHLPPPMLDDFRTRGKIPFTVSVVFYRQEQDMLDSRFANNFAIMDGQAEIAVLDADGRVVDRARKDIALLCPS